ncbi:MAG: DUF1553 domain-containing protein [Fuerstiella sp.]
MMRTIIALLCLMFQLSHATVLLAADEVDFNLDVRPILSNKCFLCHGPDPEGLQAGLRLDIRDAAISELDSGETAIVPGQPDESEMIARILTTDEDLRMPPADHGARLTEREVGILRRWIAQDARYATHWSYVPPVRPEVPEADSEFAGWPRNAVDNFMLKRMVLHGLAPSGQADRYALARRVFLDLTGLPPTVAEVDAFVADPNPNAYENLVDELLQRPSFGEHWARKWLDLARYADSAGYADDPPRTIWAYRDWVIKAFNSNMPFDQFTREQLAGDLLPTPTESQLVATAFHRNTLTNNEGGTQDEEFRNVAVVDRVNTTMAVWMGTTMACAQCHTHKYDPITQDEYFRFFAVFNNTQDADRRDESPLVQIYTDEQLRHKAELETQIAVLTQQIAMPTSEIAASQAGWEKRLRSVPDWEVPVPKSFVRSSGEAGKIGEDGRVFVDKVAAKDTYTLEFPINAAAGEQALPPISAIRLETIPHEALPGKGSGLSGGNFVITSVVAQIVPEGDESPQARFVRVTNRGKGQILSLAEVQVFSGGKNVAMGGQVTQHSTAFGGPANLAVDGNTDGDFQKNSVTHTDTVDDPWWEVDLGALQSIERVVVWNRTDNNLQKRLNGLEIELLGEGRAPVAKNSVKEPPNPSVEYAPSNIRDIAFRTATADYHQPDFEASSVLSGKTGRKDGWAVGGSAQNAHQLLLIPREKFSISSGDTLRLILGQNSTHENHLLGNFRVGFTGDDSAIQRSQVPESLLVVLDTPAAERSTEQSALLAAYYRENFAPELATQRQQLEAAEKQLAKMKPETSVPVLRELVDNRRVTHLQHRGSYLDKGHMVEPGLPEVFGGTPTGKTIDRLVVAEWLTDPANPLTSRVSANRFWETIFGRGIVVTSEEFGSQGELPTHPQLLDWLATELTESGWDTKHLIRTLVTSATYRQDATVTREKAALDPDNRWLARGPRVRLSAEMVRDQALFAAGLLSSKMYGNPVNPPQPNLGLTAAFGGSTDWKTSGGEDRYRRGLYTTWRRSNPYPSMATFDAPNREVCTVRRNSTNTPLQSLVTLNDPVYVEAAQALGRRALLHAGSLEDQITIAFRHCLLRPPTSAEVGALVALFNDSKADLSGDLGDAMKLATEPLGMLPPEIEPLDAAAMTVVCNVLLNLDEMFLKR